MGTFFNNNYAFASNLTSFNMSENTLYANNSARSMFAGCGNLNQPFNIPNYLTDISSMFNGCYNFNSEITIHPNANVIYMNDFIRSDYYNYDINIPYNTISWKRAFDLCNDYCSNVHLYANHGYVTNDEGDYQNAFEQTRFNGNVIFYHTPKNMANMFAYCGSFNQNIQIPSGPNQNCYNMFRGCSQLNRTIRLPDNVDASYAFSGCDSLSKPIVIPSNSNISYIFARCNNFNASVHIPDFVRSDFNDSSHGDAIFYDCPNLNSTITFDDSITILCNTFYNCKNFDIPVRLPSHLQYGIRTFYGCRNFNSPVELPDGLLSMNSMFASTSFNIDINIPNSVTSMVATFSSSKMNQNLHLPPNIIDMSATFQGCTVFNHRITIPSTVEYCERTFADTNLNQNIVIPLCAKDVTGMFTNCYNLSLDSMTIPQSAYRIANFAARTQVKNVIIDSSYLTWPFANFVTLAYNTINVYGKTPATTCDSIHGIRYLPASFGDDVAYININNNCIINKSGETMSFYNLWHDSNGTWNIVWQNMFGGVGASVSDFFNRRNYYNNHPVGYLDVWSGRVGNNDDYDQVIFYHDLMNAWENPYSSTGYEWNVYHVDLSFY